MTDSVESQPGLSVSPPSLNGFGLGPDFEPKESVEYYVKVADMGVMLEEKKEEDEEVQTHSSSPPFYEFDEKESNMGGKFVTLEEQWELEDFRSHPSSPPFYGFETLLQYDEEEFDKEGERNSLLGDIDGAGGQHREGGQHGGAGQHD